MISEYEWAIRNRINSEISEIIQRLEDSGWLPPHDDYIFEDQCPVCSKILIPLTQAAYVGVDWEEEF